MKKVERPKEIPIMIFADADDTYAHCNAIIAGWKEYSDYIEAKVAALMKVYEAAKNYYATEDDGTENSDSKVLELYFILGDVLEEAKKILEEPSE